MLRAAGYVDDIMGWNFGCNNNDPNEDPDPNYGGHGTNVAGLIAAAANNGVGGSGVAPSVLIMPIRVRCLVLWSWMMH